MFDFNQLITRYRNHDLHNEISGSVEPPRSEDINQLPSPHSSAYHNLSTSGQELINAGKLGLVILSGGMATRFKYDKPKGLYPVYDGRSFLELKLREAARYLGKVPVYIMTSFATDRMIRDFLATNNYFDFNPKLINIFEQYKLPRILPNGELFKSAGGSEDFTAPGHGDFAYAFPQSGLLKQFIDRGGETLWFSNVDNLGARIDPVILGMHQQMRKAMTVEVARKNPCDKGGAPARVDGHLEIVEQFKFPADFNQDKVEVFNTATYLFNAKSLTREFELPWYAVEKKVQDQQIIQFEHLAGDLSMFLNIALIEVPRAERFWPVKEQKDVGRIAELIQHSLNC